MAWATCVLLLRCLCHASTQVDQLYYWTSGGSFAGTGLPLNSTPGPYGHWSWTHYDARTDNLAMRYHAAWSNNTYTFFNGSTNSSVHLQSSTRYRSITGQNVYGWRVVPDTATYIAMCEIPIHVYTCPKSPPLASRPDPGSTCGYMQALCSALEPCLVLTAYM